MRRTLRILLAGLCLSVGLLAASTATAQTDTHGIWELRFGGYYPSIDDELGADPFAEMFGESSRLLVEFELGYYLWQGFGSLGVSGTVGYTDFGGESEIVGEGGESADLDEPTSFNVVPLRASLLYRLDVPMERWRIPLVPVAKVGLDYWLWEAEDGNGETASFDGEEGSGAKTGWHAALGLELLLDIIDEEAASAFDRNWGINNTFVFLHYQIDQIDGFGDDGFDLSDNRWVFGLAFEF